MTVHVQIDPAAPGLDLPGLIHARAADGPLDRVEIWLRFDGRTGTRKALLMLAKAAIEVCVRAREVKTPEPGRTFFLAGSWHEGVERARSLGLPPHSRTTRILTTPDSTRGLMVRDGDRVVYARPSASLMQSWRVVESISGSRESEGSRWNG